MKKNKISIRGDRKTVIAKIKPKAILADGSPQRLAKLLGVSRPTAHEHLQKPEIKKAVEDARTRALKAAGLTRIRYMKRLAEGLDAKKWFNPPFSKKMIETDAPDFKERREAAKVVAQLFRDLEPDEKEGLNKGVIVEMPAIVINGQNIQFNIGSKPRTSDVVDLA